MIEQLRQIFTELEVQGYEPIGFGKEPGDYEVFLVHPEYRDALAQLRRKLTGSEAIEFVKTLPAGSVYPTLNYLP
jgi:hypothetical protein